MIFQAHFLIEGVANGDFSVGPVADEFKWLIRSVRNLQAVEVVIFQFSTRKNSKEKTKTMFELPLFKAF